MSPDLKMERRVDWSGWAAGALLAIATIAAYRRTLALPMLLDDLASIADNPTIRHLWPIGPALHPPSAAGVGGRPLLNLSFALNYASGGTAVFGYHLVNLLIHVLAGWTLFALVRATLRRPQLAGRFGSAATPLALAVSALWCLHPLQTEAVTYLSERAESLMGLFYLLTVYCFVRYADGDGETEAKRPPPRSGGRLASVSTGWAALCVLACLAGVATKEVIVTAPLMVLLYDRTFVSGSFAAACRRHRWLYAGLAATWLPLGWLMHGLGQRGVGFGQGLTAWSYALIESRVVVKYLALVFWPKPLVFDYGPLAVPRFAEVWPDVLILAVLLGGTAWGLLGRPDERGGFRLRQGYGGQAAGFAAAWFFLILAPTSSIVPVAAQPMAESRLYLPLAGVAAGVVLGAYGLVRAKSWLVVIPAAVALGLAACHRNRSYASEAGIWSDTVAKVPANPRAHKGLGTAWLSLPGRLNDAIAQLQEALRLNPDYPDAHDNLGVAWARQPGRLNDAIAQYEVALRLKPDDAEAHNNLGNAWSKLPDRLQDAIAQYQSALRLKPDDAEAHDNLGVAWGRLSGRLQDATAEFAEAVRLKPELAGAHYHLGSAWIMTPGRSNEAIAQFQAALRLKPDFPEAQNKLGFALAKVPGRLGEAIAAYQQALRLRPDYAEAHNNLGIAWAKLPGRIDDAVGEFKAALRFQPDDAAARKNLAAALRLAAAGGGKPLAAAAP